MTGVGTLYVAGEKRESKVLTDNLRFSGGGTLRLGLLNTIRLTSLNMWNYVLSSNEIAEHATSCNGPVGNLKEWLDVWYKVKLQTNIYEQPSSCSPIAVSNPPEELGSGTNEEDDFLSRRGKSFFMKYKKKSFRKHDGKKHN